MERTTKNENAGRVSQHGTASQLVALEGATSTKRGRGMPKIHIGDGPRKRFAREFPTGPQRITAGFWGMTVYWELRRISEDFGLRGRLGAQFLKPAYLAARLLWKGRVTAVTNGVTAVTEAGLLISAGENVYQLTEELFVPAMTNAERQRKYRESHKRRNEGVTDSNGRNGPLDTPLSARDPKNPPVTVSNAEAVCGLSPAPDVEEQRSLPLLTALPTHPAAPRKAKRQEGDPLHRPLLEALLAVFQEVKGRPYGMDGGDAKAVTRLLGFTRDHGEHVRRWRNALTAERYPGTASIKVFAQRWNELGDAPPTAEEQAIRRGELRALSERVAQRERFRHY